MTTEQTKGKLKGKKRKDERLRQIARTAATLFYKNGYLQTSTRQIAEACGISQSNLYYYIKSKEDFLDLFIQMTTEAWDKSTDDVRQQLRTTSSTEALRQAVRNNLMIIDGMQDMILFWYQESKNMGKAHFSKLMDQEIHVVNGYKMIIEEGCRKGEFSAADPMLAGYDILLLCDMWALKRWYMRKRYTLEEYIEHCQDAAMNIVSGNHGC